ncbi:ubiquinone/menaquinone biosynthesis C-methylase UbiE [Mucilaginibacter frigoritolerans]|jgi:ubiquinone/menaquinone biosynthesis C-methylase UbiE|uniref:Ubiquinone/menaquinone biosynthesis C-methylase UbiE n=1 Tax=Mucilaginibacter frigoritolerans TaxID=652788 RepID=A0A562TU68_9SPHI|nr:class I SAM-dependent methyltransferase [Mucilaginibacter frigoritolerans]TWI96754.1 ubiquinone/menaquinone biosynthesis C-methylase UbiE [Mucilaginibacter frigoritolerans]
MEAIYNTIGNGYNFTRKADPYLTSRIIHFLQPQTKATYLDIGCGTGNYTIALSKHGLNITGVEPSETMLEVAKGRNKQVNWLAGTAEQIPAKNEAFNGAIATLTIHHWTDINQALKEIYRVTDMNGKFVLFTATPQQMQGYWLNHYFPNMMQSSINQMPGLDIIQNGLLKAGFNHIIKEKYSVQDNLEDHFLYSGKLKPSLYLDKEIRNGISSFTALANAKEIADGLSELEKDISNGKFEEIKSRYENNSGDYLFVVAEKI